MVAREEEGEWEIGAGIQTEIERRWRGGRGQGKNGGERGGKVACSAFST